MKIILRTFQRFNPFCKPVIPVQLALYLLAVVFTLLFIRDRILCTFITEYKELTLSAWGFLLLMNFLEALLETRNETDEKN
ncbi:MAG: hypothetical protein WCJ26_15055 [bacterium]